MTNFSEVKTQFTWKSEAAWPSLCQTGKLQSPIDFPSSANYSYNTTQIIQIEKSSYEKASFKLSVKNNEFFQIEMAKNGYIIVTKNDIKYRYDGINFYFHYASEHTVRGLKSDMEIQIIHQKNNEYLLYQDIFDDPDKANQRLAISIMIKVSGPINPDIGKLNLSTLGPTSNDFDLNRFIPIKKPFYYYKGSSTSPDCSEDINWIVQQDPILISQSQFDMFKNWIIGTTNENNSRQVKPLNGRQLYYQFNGLITQSELIANSTHNSALLQPQLLSEPEYVPVENELNKSDESKWPPLCSEGKKQSPIDFPNSNKHYSREKIVEIISSHLTSASLELSIFNMLFNVNITGRGHVIIKKRDILYKYDAYSFHFHHDSEHTFGEIHTDLEIHFLFIKDAAYLAANGVLVDPDIDNLILIITLFIQASGNIVNEVFDKLNIDTLGPTDKDFDLNAFVPIKRPIYFYEGGQTRPACTENVNYIVATDILLVSEKSVNKIIDWIVTYSGGKNRRKTFPLYDRIIYYQTYSDPILDAPEPVFKNTYFDNPASPQKAIETYTGPISWAKEDSNTWTDICSQGKEQSPIDLAKDTSKYDKTQTGYIISTHYNKNSYKLAIKDNRMWYVDMTDGGFVLMQYINVQYKFNIQSINLHYNSEHTIDGKHSDVEIQIKHKKDANYLRERGWRVDPNNQRDVLFISIRYEVGETEDSNFSKINIKGGSTFDSFDLNNFIDTLGSFYFYIGSDTLPPCVEDAYWIIMEKTITISQSQLDEVKSWIKTTTNEMNSRSVKKINDRVVYYTKNPHNLSKDVDILFGRSKASSNKLVHRLIVSISLILLVI